MISRVPKLMLLLSFFVSFISLQAQTTGAIIDMVQDSSGTLLANAKVTLTSVSTGTPRSTKTNGSGTNTPSFLLPGANDPTLTCQGTPGAACNASNPNFGKLSSGTATGRQIQFSLKLYY